MLDKPLKHTILKANKNRFYPSKEQELLLNKTFGCVRFIWNQQVSLFLGKRLEETKTIKELKEIYDWLKEVPYNALEQKLQDFNQFKNQFFNKKRKKKLGSPKFKKKGYNDSFRLNPNAFKLEKGILTATKLGVLKTKGYDLTQLPNSSKTKENKIKSITISKNSLNQFFVSILVEETRELKEHNNQAIGIDLGLKDLFILSNGYKISNPKKFHEKQMKLKRLQRQLSRKTKSSNRYHKQRIKIARLHKKITEQRNYFLHCFSSYLVDNFSEIFIEDLNIQGMIKNKKLSKAIQNACWSKFVSMIEYKTKWYGRTLIKIDRFYPSSKTCSSCGYKLEKLELSIREWKCPECDSYHDRDLNASINIGLKGLEELYGLEISNPYKSEEYSDYIRRDFIRPLLDLRLAESMKRIETL